MNYFPNDEEKELLKFIARYQYININDVQYFFSSKSYYKKRITHFVSNKFLKRIKLNLVLDKVGMEYLELFGIKHNKLNRSQKYFPRLKYLSNFGAFYHNCDIVEFTPSFELKNKEIYTITARRYIGVLNINGIEHLIYYIPKENGKRYLTSVIYDIQKETQYKNIIILTNEISSINISDFCFGVNQVLIVEDIIDNREKLKYMHNIDWTQIMNEYYPDAYLVEYNFCDYTNGYDKYISEFYFLDAERINRIKYFLRENQHRNADIICNKEIKSAIQKELPNCNYTVIDIEKYIDRKPNIYYCE